ncbi:MAG: hypothetical protein AB1765_04660 [Candidatus Hydrogenedentota bacterium]
MNKKLSIQLKTGLHLSIIIIFISFILKYFQPSFSMHGDDCYFFFLAQEIAEKSGFIDPVIPPKEVPFTLYPLLISFFVPTKSVPNINSNLLSIKILSLLFTIISLVFIIYIGRSLNLSRSLLLILYCLSPFVIYYSSQILPETGLLLLVVLILYGMWNKTLSGSIISTVCIVILYFFDNSGRFYALIFLFSYLINPLIFLKNKIFKIIWLLIIIGIGYLLNLYQYLLVNVDTLKIIISYFIKYYPGYFFFPLLKYGISQKFVFLFSIPLIIIFYYIISIGLLNYYKTNPHLLVVFTLPLLTLPFTGFTESGRFIFPLYPILILSITSFIKNYYPNFINKLSLILFIFYFILSFLFYHITFEPYTPEYKSFNSSVILSTDRYADTSSLLILGKRHYYPFLKNKNVLLLRPSLSNPLPEHIIKNFAHNGIVLIADSLKGKELHNNELEYIQSQNVWKLLNDDGITRVFYLQETAVVE